MRTAPSKARQNDVAERINRTMNERTKSMKIHSGLPKKICVNAVNSIAYLIKRGLSVPLEFKLIEEVWIEKNSSTLT